jgi:Major capsid protein Gp23
MANIMHINRDQAELLVEKWAPVLDFASDKVRAITDDNTRLNTAILLQNQENYLAEQNFSGTNSAGGVFGSTLQGTGTTFSGDHYATGDARLPKVLIPMIRRTFPELITNEIVGVQPMTGPVGLAFAMRYRYDDTALGYSAAGGDGNNSSGSIAAGNSNNKELGYNYLNTAFTGASSAALSGLPGVWDNLVEDSGVGALISQFELSSKIPQITVSFEKTAVEALTRRLAAKWSVELEQDLKNMNGIDIDSELTNAMSYEIQAEIDREMIMRMIQICLNAGNGNGFTTWSAVSADARWSAERARDFYNRLVVEANRVAIRNRRGAANFIIGTPRICAILETLPNFTWQPVTGNVNTAPVGIAKVGSVGGRFQIYRDTRTEAELNSPGTAQAGYYTQNAGGGYITARTNPIDYALLGYKGTEYYDSGILYCPYIPVMVQRTIGPNDFSPRVGLLTRYGVVDHIFGSALYYHLVICTGLGSSFQPNQAATYL